MSQVPKLVFAKQKFDLQNTPVSLGRDSSNDIVLNDPSVSSQHARLEERAGQWCVLDLGSTNGTRVNGNTNHLEPLTHGDVLEFGQLQAQFVVSNQAMPQTIRIQPPQKSAGGFGCFSWLGAVITGIVITISGLIAVLLGINQLAEQGAKASVKIFACADDSCKPANIGSGVVVKVCGQNLILTNYHNVKYDKVLKIAYNTTDPKSKLGGVLNAKIAHSDEALDLVLLETSDIGLFGLELGDSDALTPNEPLDVFGFPPARGENLSFFRTEFGGFESSRNDDKAWLKLNKPVQEGNSGGAVTNVAGQLVGIVTNDSSGGSGLAIPSNLITSKFFKAKSPCQ